MPTATTEVQPISQKRLSIRTIAGSTLIVATVLFVVAFVPRLIAISRPPAQVFYNTDELDVIHSSLDRFSGLPTVIPMEPTTPLQMIAVPALLGDAAVNGRGR